MKLSKTIRVLIIVIILLVVCTAWTVFSVSIEPEREKTFLIWLPDKRNIVSGVKNVLKRGRRLGGIGGIGIMQIEITEEQFQERYPDYRFKWITVDFKDSSLIMDYYGKESLQATHIEHYRKTYKYEKGPYRFDNYTVNSEKQQVVVTLKKDWFMLCFLGMLIIMIIGYFSVMFLLFLP